VRLALLSTAAAMALSLAVWPSRAFG